MKATPREFVSRALTIFEEAFRTRMSQLGPTLPREKARDLLAVLGYILDNLEVLFPIENERIEARCYVHELRIVRNKFSHSDPIDSEYAYRAADTAGRLLNLLGSEDLSANSLKRELRSLEAQDSVYAGTPEAMPRPTPGNVSTVNIIACSKLKQNQPAPAVELYTGPLFQTSLEVARSEGLPVLILSTRYGLVDPDHVIEPYDLSYEAMTPSERERLIQLLRTQLGDVLDFL